MQADLERVFLAIRKRSNRHTARDLDRKRASRLANKARDSGSDGDCESQARGYTCISSWTLLAMCREWHGVLHGVTKATLNSCNRVGRLRTASARNGAFRSDAAPNQAWLLQCGLLHRSHRHNPARSPTACGSPVLEAFDPAFAILMNQSLWKHGMTNRRVDSNSRI